MKQYQPIYTIYVIEHILTGKVYVGMTGYLEARRRSHFQTPSPKTVIGHEMIRLGADQFVFREVDHAKNSMEAGLRERFWTHLLESNDPQFGYNNPNIYRMEPLPPIERLMLPVHGMGGKDPWRKTCRFTIDM